MHLFGFPGPGPSRVNVLKIINFKLFKMVHSNKNLKAISIRATCLTILESGFRIWFDHWVGNREGKWG